MELNKLHIKHNGEKYTLYNKDEDKICETSNKKIAEELIYKLNKFDELFNCLETTYGLIHDLVHIHDAESVSNAMHWIVGYQNASKDINIIN